MLGVRDLAWSALICAALTLLVQCRPAWSARRTVERDARDAFFEAYEGHRTLGGEVIAPTGKNGVRSDPLASPVTYRRFEITADRLSWGGNKAELVARHVVELGGEPASTIEAHVKLEKRGRRWMYTLFEVRNGAALDELDSGNPWLRVLQPEGSDDGEEEYEEDAENEGNDQGKGEAGEEQEQDEEQKEETKVQEEDG
jgi:hypothetical protein